MVMMEDLDLMEHLVKLEHQAEMVKGESLDNKVKEEQMVFLVHLVNAVCQELMGLQAYQALMDNAGNLGNQEKEDHLVKMEFLDKMVLMDYQVIQEVMDYLESEANLVKEECQENQEIQEPMETPDLQEHLDKQVLQAHLVQLAYLDNKVHQVKEDRMAEMA